MNNANNMNSTCMDIIKETHNEEKNKRKNKINRNMLRCKRIFSVVLLALLLSATTGIGFNINSGTNVYAYTEAELDYITDQYGLLDDVEYEELNSMAEEISEYYDFGVYAVIVDDYTYYGDGNIFDVATQIYSEYNLGHGDGKDGLMLMLSMYDRDYVLITYGDFGNYAFNDEGRIAMTDYFLDDFADDYWYGGMFDYLDISNMYLEAAANGNPYSADNILITEEERMELIALDVATILIIPLIVALIAIFIMQRKMKSVAMATSAYAYAEGELELRQRQDIYKYSTETRTKIESSKSSGTSTHKSGGFSGTSGKF